MRGPIHVQVVPNIYISDAERNITAHAQVLEPETWSKEEPT